MLPILPIKNIQEWDAFTIDNEPISSIDLMERASNVFVTWFLLKIEDENPNILVVTGKGNNGGDGLAVARLLHEKSCEVDILIADIQQNGSANFNTNLQRLKDKRIPYSFLVKDDNIPSFSKYDIIIDAIFGSGLTRPITGFWSSLIDAINTSQSTIFSIDIPSGMYSDKPVDGIAIKCDFCLSFETPKLGMLFSDNKYILKSWEAKSIGLKQEYLESIKIENYLIQKQDIRKIIKPRNKFDHKGKYGHALIAGGSKGMIGAAVLSSKACLRTGAGLVTALIPDIAYDIVQISNPEVMTMSGYGDDFLTAVPNINKFNAIGLGIGLGKHKKTVNFIKEFLTVVESPLVIDADALNIIAENKELIEIIPKGSILSPHPKEFSRLFGPTKNVFDRIKLLRKKSIEHDIYIILKGAYTAISDPSGNIYFNTTGNPGMASAGSGDVLTGILTSLLAQGYSKIDSCIFGVYLHGFAGDIAAQKKGQYSLIAGDIVNNISEAIREFED